MPLEFVEDGHRYYLDGAELTHVTHVLKVGGMIETSWFNESVRSRGVAVHKACELDDLGVLDESSLDDRIRPYLDAWRLFRKEHTCDWLAVEERVCCDLYRYAGCIDRRGYIDGAMSIGDIKTGTDHPATALQLAAYAGTFEYGSLYQRVAIHLSSEGTYKLVLYKHDSYRRDLEVFRSLLNVLRWTGSIE